MSFQARFIHDGNAIDYTPSGDIAAGEVVVIGNVCAIAMRPIAANTLGALLTRGVFDVAKATPLVINAGDAVYWNDGTNLASKTSTGIYMGIAVAAAGSADTTVRVFLRSMEDVVGEQLGLADLSDVDAATPTAGNVLIADGDSFEPGKLGALSAGNVAGGGIGIPLVIRQTCTAAGAEDETVIAALPVKVRILDAHMIARDTNVANVKLHSGTAGSDDITDAVAKGETDDARVGFGKLIAEKVEVASGSPIKANFSAAGSVEVVILAVTVA